MARRYAAEVDDEALLAALLKGDEAAFRELVGRYHETLVRVAQYYVGSRASAEDVAQETWVAVLKGIHRFEGRSSLKTWLLRVLANRARTTGAREHRQLPVDPTAAGPTVDASRFDAGGAWSEPPEPFTDTIERRLDDAAVIADVRAAIAALPETQRAVVTLRDVEGLSTAEVAVLLALTEVNVRVLLHRGRARVRAALEDTVRGGVR